MRGWIPVVGVLLGSACQLISGIDAYGDGVAGSLGGAAQGGSGVGGGGGVVDVSVGGAGEGGAPPALCLDAVSAGETHWAVRYGDGDTDVVQDVVAGPDGTVFIAGEFEGDIFTEPVSTSRGFIDGFVARLDRCGELLWHRHIEGVGFDRAATAAYFDGVLYVAGSHTNTVTIEDLPELEVQMNGTGSLFVAAFEGETGKALWAKTFGGTGTILPGDIAVRSTGASATVVVGGSFDGDADFGAAGQPTVAGEDAVDAFILRLTPEGDEQSPLTRFTGEGSESVTAVGVDSSGNIWAALAFDEGLITPGDTVPIIADGWDGYVARIAPSGQFEQGVAFGGTRLDLPLDLTIMGNKIIVAGLFTGSYRSVGNANGADGFIQRIDATSLSLEWTRIVGGGGDFVTDGFILGALVGFGELSGDGVYNIVADANGSKIYVAVSCREDFSIGPGTDIDCGGDQDVVVFELDAATGEPGAWIERATGVGNDLPTGIVRVGVDLVATGTFRNAIHFGNNEGELEAQGDERDVFLTRIRTRDGQ